MLKKPKSYTESEFLSITRSLSTSPQIAERLDDRVQRTTPIASTVQQSQVLENELLGNLSIRDSRSVPSSSRYSKFEYIQSKGIPDEGFEISLIRREQPLARVGVDELVQDSNRSPAKNDDESKLVPALSPLELGLLELASTEISSLGGHENFEQPAASSLVSPPASSHDGTEKSPPSRFAITHSASSSRHSPRPLKQVQRCTPESGSVRRTSSSSAGDIIVSNSILTTDDLLVPEAEEESEVHLAHGDVKIDVGPGINTDDESLKLIKAIQAQEHGLRRRGGL